MGQENFIRKYRLDAGREGRQGFSIGETDEKNPHALHISFSIEKSDKETANNGKVQVWNLSGEHLRVLDMKDCAVHLYAGYADHTPLILAGDVVSVSTQADGADRLTEIEVVDGRTALRDTYVTVTFNGKTNSKLIFDYMASRMGMAAIYSPKCRHRDMAGFSFVGKAKAALDKLCGMCGLSWSIQNQVLHVKNPNEAVSSRAYLISASTGLVDIPKRISLAAESADSMGNTSSGTAQTGYEIRYLLNGAVGVNDLVRLESSIINGYFRVYKLTLDGDNLAGEWTCTAQVLEVK